MKHCTTCQILLGLGEVQPRDCARFYRSSIGQGPTSYEADGSIGIEQIWRMLVVDQLFQMPGVRQNLLTLFQLEDHQHFV